MPGVTGAEVAEQLKHLSPNIPIVLMSAFPELPESLLRMVDGYVRKGQDPEVMIGAISNALTPGKPKSLISGHVAPCSYSEDCIERNMSPRYSGALVCRSHTL